MGLYASKFDVIARAIEDGADNLVRQAIVAVGTNVVRGTPIDTGQARRNWRAALDQPILDTLAEPMSQVDGEREALTAIRQMAADYKYGQTAHITNNLPYIQELNSGSSRQAPAMFVENAILSAVRSLNGRMFK